MSLLTRVQKVFQKRSSTMTGGSLKNYNPDFWNDFFNISSSNQVAVTANSSLQMASVYAVVDRISKTFAALPFRVYQKKGASRHPASNHDQFFLLSQQPSDLYTSYNFRRALRANYELWGDGYARIVRNPMTSRPVSYILEHPSDIDVFIDNETAELPFIYYFKSSTNEIIWPENMIHISDLNMNGLKGLSKISLHKDGIGVGLSATKMAKKLYENGLHLGGILEFEKTLTKEQLEKYRQSFQSIYGGMTQAGKVAALDEGTKFKPLTYTMPLSDAQYIESRNLQKKDIAQIFDYPIELLEGSSNTSNNSMEQIMINYVQSNIAPFATMVEQEFNRKIFRIAEKGTFYTKLELKGLLRGDIKTRSEFYKTLFGAGAMNADEIRAAEDLTPLPDNQGKKYYIPANNLVPVTQIEEYVQAIINSKMKNTKA